MFDAIADYGLITAFLASVIRLSMPLAYAAVGGIFSERAGVFNVGLEGFLIIGAFGAAYGTFHTGSPYMGLLMGLLCGCLLAIPMAIMTVSLGVNQIVAGIAVNLFALGFTAFLSRVAIGPTANTKLLPGFSKVAIPGLSKLPFVGPIFFNQDLLVYLMYVAVPVLYYIMFRTAWGLNIRAVGHSPRSSDTAGLSVTRVRYVAIIGGNMFVALGGCYLVLSQVFVFSEDMTAGKGFIAIAAMILGRWSPLGALLAALLFGFFDALQLRLQFSNPDVPYEIFTTLPYVMSILALILFAGRNVAPQAIGRFYSREDY